MVGGNPMSTLRVNRIEPRTGDSVEIIGLDIPEPTESPIKAWVNFNGTGTVAINDEMNVSSITDNGVGDYTVNFETAMDSDNYSFVGSSANTDNSAGNSTTNRGYFMDIKQPDSKATVKTTSSINVVTFQLAPDRYRTPVDFKENSLVIVGS
jgi:hypothetical protein